MTPGALTHVELAKATRLYGSTVALREASARFDAGSVTVLEGPNGSGKSTMLGLLSTSVRPTSGAVTWHPLGDDRATVRPHVGWLGHEAGVYPDLSGEENLRWAAALYGLDAGAAARACDRVGLGRVGLRPVRTLSRGQRQRVARARARVHAPSLLLLDEPSTGLDTAGTALLLALVQEELTRGAIVALVTHDPALGDALGARRLRLERGRIVDGLRRPQGSTQLHPVQVLRPLQVCSVYFLVVWSYDMPLHEFAPPQCGWISIFPPSASHIAVNFSSVISGSSTVLVMTGAPPAPLAPPSPPAPAEAPPTPPAPAAAPPWPAPPPCPAPPPAPADAPPVPAPAPPCPEAPAAPPCPGSPPAPAAAPPAPAAAPPAPAAAPPCPESPPTPADAPPAPATAPP